MEDDIEISRDLICEDNLAEIRSWKEGITIDEGSSDEQEILIKMFTDLTHEDNIIDVQLSEEVGIKTYNSIEDQALIETLRDLNDSDNLDEVISTIDEAKIDISAEEDSKKSNKKKVTWEEIGEDYRPKAFELPNPTLHIEKRVNMPSIFPIDIFKTFFDSEFWELLEDQTNLYRLQLREEKRGYLEAHPKARLGRKGAINQNLLKRWFAARLLIPLHSNAELHGVILLSIILK